MLEQSWTSNYIFILCFLIGLHSDVQHKEFWLTSIEDELLQMIVDTAERG